MVPRTLDRILRKNSIFKMCGSCLNNLRGNQLFLDNGQKTINHEKWPLDFINALCGAGVCPKNGV